MKKSNLKKGMLMKSKNSKVILKLISVGGNGHWTCTQINRKKSHHVHEGTLVKYYEKYKPKEE